MKRLFILILILFVAATYTDTTNANFNAGNGTNINVTANSVILSGPSSNYSASGVFESQIFDLGSNPNGTLAWNVVSQSGTTLLVTSRSGPTSSVGGSWSSYTSAYADNASSTITAPRNRYHQYRLQLGTTNTSLTPQVTDVTLTYAQAGPQIGYSASTSDLTEESSGTFRFYAQINDTIAYNASARYRLGSGSYSGYSSMTATSNNRSYIDISEPGAGWDSLENENITIQVNVTNGLGNASNATLIELVDNVNQPPVLTNINDVSATEGTLKSVYVSASDPDGQSLSWYSSIGTIAATSSTQATMQWTPSDEQTGNFTITITVSDGVVNVSQNLTATVADTNSVPSIAALTDQSGHYGDRISFTVTVSDNDTADSIAFRVDPPYFTVDAYNDSNSSSNTTYFGRANFTLLDDHRGNTTYIITADDGDATDTANITISSTYCGDNVCQAVENATSCRADCYEEEILNYAVLSLPSRFCVGANMTLTSYNASRRYNCYIDGKTFESNALCNELESVDIQIYSINDTRRSSVQTLSTGSDGTVVFVPSSAGMYKLIAEKDEYLTTEYLVTVKSCNTTIDSSQNIVTYERPEVTKTEYVEERPPQFERPEVTPEEVTLLSILIFYIIIPLLGAAFLYVGSIWYDMNRETNPVVLKMRIAIYQGRMRVASWLLPVWRAIAPYVEPILDIFDKYIVTPLWEKGIRPLWTLTKRVLRLK